MRSYKERTQDILERAQTQQKAQRSKRKKLLSVTAACLSVLLVFNLILFIPFNTAPPDISAYKDSEYYPLMQQLNALTYKPPKYKNNFERLCEIFSEGFGMGKATAEAPAAEQGTNGSYAEVTDNQVQGVIEGDLFKRTDEYIFYLNAWAPDGSYVLHAYSIAQGDSSLIETATISPEENTKFLGYQARAELYLSADGNTVTVFTPTYYNKTQRLYTAIVGIDVSDPAHMREIGRTYVSGNYISSRKIGDEFLLISELSITSSPDFSDQSQFLPQTGALDELQSLPMCDIIRPENATAARYTVVCRIDESDLSIDGHYAFLSYTDEAYVSQENVFVARNYTHETEQDGVSFRETASEIACVSYADGTFVYRGSATVPGTIRNQYSMDEYEGNLRVATTLWRNFADIGQSEQATLPASTNAGLYVLSLSDFSVLGAAEWFAPEGESVMSARFDGNTAWICTALDLIELTDPVFCFDLSDPNNISSTDTGTISGYSLSLVDFKDGTLLGIGYGETRNDLKIEIYAESGNSVLSVARYEAENTTFSESYKAYLIDRERGLIGLHANLYAEGEVYLLLQFDGYDLVEISKLSLNSSYTDQTRAALIDGWLYVLTVNVADFQTVRLDV